MSFRNLQIYRQPVLIYFSEAFLKENLSLLQPQGGGILYSMIYRLYTSNSGSFDIAHCVPCNTFGEQREIYGWIRLFLSPPENKKAKFAFCTLKRKGGSTQKQPFLTVRFRGALLTKSVTLEFSQDTVWEGSHSTKKYYFEHCVSCIISYNISIYHILLSSFSILNIVSANRWRTTAVERLFQREILTTGDNNGQDQPSEVRFASIYKIYCKDDCRPFMLDNIRLFFFQQKKGGRL